MTHMLIINLHETEYLEDVLDALAEESVRDCVVYNAEGIVSRHGESVPSYGFFREGLSSLLESKRNQNLMIQAVVNQDSIDAISNRLKSTEVEDRWAVSFWFSPIEGYFYHKGEDKLD